MDMDRKQVSEIKNECLQMPDYIRDRIEETVQQQVTKKQHGSRRIWRAAAAVLAFCCMASGTTFATTTLYKMHLEKQGKYGSTLIYGDATDTDAQTETADANTQKEATNTNAQTGADANLEALYTLDVSYIPEGMEIDGLDGIYADGNNYVSKVSIFPSDKAFMGGVSFVFWKMPSDKQSLFNNTYVVSTQELEIDGKQAVIVENQTMESATADVRYKIYVTYDNNYLLDMCVYDDTELETAIDIVKGLTLTPTDDPAAKRRILVQEYIEPNYEVVDETANTDQFTKTSKKSMEHLHQIGETFDVPNSSLKAKVSKVELLDSPNELDTAYELDSIETDAAGKLVNNVIAYEKYGDGINQLDEVVATKEVKEKILYIEVEYTNTGKTQTGDTLYDCELIRAKETDDGYEIVDVYAIDSLEYDSYYGQNYMINGSPIYYYNGKSVEEKNHLIHVQPGETRTVTWAFLVSEDELPYLFLDLFSGSSINTEFNNIALSNGYVDIRQ